MSADTNSLVLVTGGRGFLGRAVVELLRRSTDSVISLDEVPVPAACPSCDSEVLCDITDADQLLRVCEGRRIGGIVHLAAILPTAAQREPLRATQVNVAGSLNLLEMARRCGVRRFVLASSVSVYGTCPMNHAVSEADRAAPEDLYGAAKVYVEQLGQAYRECHGLEFVSLRIGRVVGPGARSASSAWRSQIFEGLGRSDTAAIELPYVGSERILVVHVDDVAKMLVTLLRAPQPAHTVYNAPCESVVVGDLKHEVEGLNANLSVKLGDRYAVGNPRLLDCSRFQREFRFRAVPIFEQLRRAAGK
jgi:nucleoside-diphosphate-sugar epimerase